MLETLPLLFFGKSAPLGHLWLENFGPYKWFTTPLLAKFISENGIPRSLVVKNKDQVPYLINSHLRELMPWGDWDNISATQIRQTLSGLTVRLDKAIQVICIIHAILSNQETYKFPFEIEEIRDDLGTEALILPACYTFEDRALLDAPELIGSLKDKKVFVSDRELIGVVREIQLGFTMTEFLANTISKILYVATGKDAEAYLLEDRTDTLNGYMTRPILHPNGGQHQSSNIVSYLEGGVIW